ncbi:ATP-dependent DNA ligase [bacterium]|nr:MAG: ATP-dependent DNA ligase [bacterium]
MKRFAALYSALDETTKTNEKVAAMVAYFREAEPTDAAWAIHFLTGRRLKRLIQSGKLRAWAAEAAGLPEWLFGESYDAVGDLAETIALVLPDHAREAEGSLATWVEDRVAPLAKADEETQKALVIGAWSALGRSERFVFNKLITGAFRVGVSQELVVRALSQVGEVPAPTISHRLMGEWEPTEAFYRSLFDENSGETDVSRPYPFMLAHAFEAETSTLGEPGEWLIEWKWDGIRAQVIRREGKTFIWSRGEELIGDRFPEIAEIGEKLADGTVIDGEILAFREGKPLPFMELQKRIGRKTLSKKILSDVPVVLVAFDLLEQGGEDLRERPTSERRERLETLVESFNETTPLAAPVVAPLFANDEVDQPSRLLVATKLQAATWEEFAAIRATAREHNVEGLMIKRLDAPYVVGRKRGLWWKWKIEPLTVDAVMIYAQAGSGKRASLYTDYTFAVWDGDQLVPFAKAYSGLTDEEIGRVDSWVRRHTKEKFGPVRTVEPELVMELAFEGIQLSSRHKSGIAVRFPRILRWRHDKLPKDADRLEDIRKLVGGGGG